MKTLYLDIFSGISGDMFIGALLDLGVDARQFEFELQKLKLDGYHLHIGRGQKAGISGIKFDVHLHEHAHEHTHANGITHSHTHSQDHSHSHPGGGPHGGQLVETTNGQMELSVFETDVPPRFRLYFLDRQGKPIAPPSAATVVLKTVRPSGATQPFKFKRASEYLEATTHLPEPHQFTATITLKHGRQSEKAVVEFVEDHDHHHHHEHHHHHHHHDHEHSHHHAEGHDHEHTHGRNFAEITKLIQASELSDWVKKKAIAVFRRIAVAEGTIHGQPPEQVHFHEVGAVDSIVDIVGGCIGLEMLGKPRVLSAPVVEGVGWIDCAHGRFPIPAPATLNIFAARSIPITQCEEPHELVTPTGAALLAEFVEEFGLMRGLAAQRIGFGLGTRDNRTRPNVLRAILGTVSTTVTPHDWQTDTIAVLQTNLDDLNAEILGHFVEQALAAGALDVFHTPIQMKKNRPGVLLTILCAETDADKFSELLLRQTSAFGIRRYQAERRKLLREFVSVRTEYGEVTVKLGKLDGKIVQAAPEFESCRKLAEQANVPLKNIYEAANRAIRT